MEKYYHPYYVNYFTTDNGRIYSSKTGRELKGTKTKNGYNISIRPKGKNQLAFLHMCLSGRHITNKRQIYIINNSH